MNKVFNHGFKFSLFLFFTLYIGEASANWVYIPDTAAQSAASLGGAWSYIYPTSIAVGGVFDASGVFTSFDALPVIPAMPQIMIDSLGTAQPDPFPYIDWLSLGSVSASIALLWATAFGIGITASVFKNGA